MFIILGMQSVGSAEEEHSFLDRDAEEEHCQAVDTYSEAAVGRTAVAEELGVELNVLAKSLLCRIFAELLIAVLSLCARGDLNAAPDKVVALGNAVFVSHMIEGTLVLCKIGNEEELVAVKLLNETVGHTLSVGGKVAFLGLGAGIAVSFLKKAVDLGNGKNGERTGGNNDLEAEDAFDILAVLLLYTSENVGEHLLLKSHYVVEGLNVGELKVEGGELGRVLVGVRLFSAEARRTFEDSLETRCHCHLLVELGRLRKIRITVKIVELEDLGARLGSRADDLGEMKLGKLVCKEIVAESRGDLALNVEDEGVALGTEVYPTVVKARVDRGVFLDGERVRDGFDADRGGDDLLTAHFYVFVSDALALDGNDGVDGELINDGSELVVAFLLNVYLNLARDITDNEEGACLLVTAVFNKTGDLYLFTGLDVSDKCSFHFLTLSRFGLIFAYIIMISQKKGKVKGK